MGPERDGRAPWVSGETQAVRAAAATRAGAEAQSRDAQAGLEESEAHFRQFCQDGPVACQSLDETGHVRDVNAAWLEALGYTRGEVIGRWLGDFLTAASREQFRHRFPHFKRDGLIRGAEFELVHKDGRALVFAMDGRVSRDAGGRFQQAHCILHDITAQRRAAADVAQRARELAALHTLTQRVCANLSLGEVARAALAGLDGPVAPDLALLFLRVGDELQLQAYRAPSALEEHLRSPVHRVGECLCGVAVSNGTPIFAADILSDPRCTLPECRDAGLRSFAALPLRGGDAIVGVLGLASKTPRDFAAQAEFLETLSRAIGMGVQNALLYEQLRANAARLGVVNEELQQEVAARRRAEDLLRASEDRFRTLVQSATTVVLYLAPDGRILEFNPEAERIYGRTRAEVLGQNYFDRLLPPDVRADVLADLPRLLAGEPLRSYEKSLRAADGREHTLLWNVDCLFDDDGKPSGILAIAQDITERKRAEDQLRGRLQQLTSPADEELRLSFADLFDMAEIQRIQDAFAAATGVASIITQPDGTPLTRPSNFCRLCSTIIRRTGKGLENCMRSDAVLGQPNPDGPIVRPCLSGGLWDAGASIFVGEQHIANWLIGQVRNADLDEERLCAYAREIGADEAEFRAALAEVTVMSTEQFRNVAHALFLVANQMSQLAFQNVQQGRAIHARALAEEAVREREARLKSIFRAAPVGIGVVVGRVFREVNDQCCLLTGYTRDELLGQSARLIYPSDEDFEYVGRAKYAQIQAHGAGTVETRWRRKDGEIIDVLLSSAPLDPADLTKGVSFTVLDITARRRAAEEKARLEAQLRQSQKLEAIGQLAGGVAHDFNNILTAILGNTELAIAGAEAGAPGNALLEELRQIDRSAQRAAGLTRQLLAFSRRQVSQPTILNLNQTLLELEKMLRRLLTENVALTIDAAPDLHAVRIDAGQIEQVIVNLAVNARDAMPDGGHLVIATANAELDPAYVATHAEARTGMHVVLSVSDTGCGMDASMLERVFEPFFTTKGLGQGTGLGLATVYGIVRQAGGHVTVYSEPRKGSTFRVYLPAVDAPPVAYTLEGQEEHAPGGHEAILVCEDDATVRQLTVHLLGEAGYAVTAAENGARALELAHARQTPVDLLITDVIMPELNGKKVSEALTELWPALRTLYVSGYTSNVIAHHGVLDAGVQFLEKPFSRRALLQRVRQVLDA
ncbi:MAG: PAS domain S-box protein [Phycisphaerae bacterium]|nr:PAS domain S-box protein [Phycisphaerae bacterium]